MWKTNTAPQTRHPPSHSLMCERRGERQGETGEEGRRERERERERGRGEELYRGLREMSNYNAVPFNMARLTLERGLTAPNVQMADTICYCAGAVAGRIDNRSDDESKMSRAQEREQEKKFRTSCSALHLALKGSSAGVWLK